MKSILNLVLLLFISLSAFSQTPTPVSKIIYFDSIWKESTEDNYKYYRIIKDYYTDRNTYNVSNYYKSGTLEMAGMSSNKDYLVKEGQFAHYYENGNKKTVSKYTKSKPVGKQYHWYENGQPKSEIEYLENQKEIDTDPKINQFYNSQHVQTVIDGNGEYEDLNNGFFESGKIKNGFHDGNWKGRSKKPNYTFVENYENGKLISGTSIDSSNIEHSYKKVYQYPVPKKGMNNFYSYIGKAIKIPNAAKNTVFGKIYLTFVIETDGSIVETKIIKGLGYGLDEEAIRILKNYKDWNPGIMRGIPVRVLYSLPITIAK